MYKKRSRALLPVLTLLLTGLAVPVWAEGEVSNEMFAVNNTWMMVATFLVFIMNLGFAMVETGLCRAKNATNILFKNTVIPAIGILGFALIGFNLMYPGDFNFIKGVFGFAGFGIGTDAAGVTSAYNAGYTYWTDFLFQAMFAATAATIVSGAVAERVKLSSFLVFSAVYVTLIYPFVGSWTWGGGWLKGMNFHDFAGSTLVHSVGGWGALAGALVLGPRIGKYINGKVKPIMGHNLAMVTIGVFMLWLGWFGFNGGSVLSADPGMVSFVLLTTTLAAAAGTLSSMMTSWIIQKKPDFTMVLNGCLAGLVGITAGADVVSPLAAVIIGLVAGVLAVLGVMFFDKLKIDDPVGALSVHLVNGVFGTLAVGIFSTSPDYTFMTQLIGVLSYGVFCFPAALLIFFVLKKTMGIRVSEEEELKGLDIGEHGQEAYSGFQFFTNS
jgi:Amt family ammonium transporter